MFRNLFRPRASKDVQASMDYLLNFKSADFVKSLFSRYPSFDTVIARKHKEGIDIVPIAVELLAGALSDIVYRSRLPREEAAAIANYILGESDEITPVDGRLTNVRKHS